MEILSQLTRGQPGGTPGSGPRPAPGATPQNPNAPRTRLMRQAKAAGYGRSGMPAYVRISIPIDRPPSFQLPEQAPPPELAGTAPGLSPDLALLMALARARGGPSPA